jgi:hypothetical protein
LEVASALARLVEVLASVVVVVMVVWRWGWRWEVVGFLSDVWCGGGVKEVSQLSISRFVVMWFLAFHGCSLRLVSLSRCLAASSLHCRGSDWEMGLPSDASLSLTHTCKAISLPFLKTL